MLSLFLLCLLVQTGACSLASNTTSDLYLMFLATCADGAVRQDCVDDTRSAVQLAVDHVNTNLDLNRHGYTLVLTEKLSTVSLNVCSYMKNFVFVRLLRYLCLPRGLCI